MVLYDPEVNVGILREADGIVTIQDCHNIDVFSRSNKLLYLVPYDGNIKSVEMSKVNNNFNDRASINSYSEWMSIYKDYIKKDYYDRNWNYYEILAGITGLKLKILPKKYFDRVGEVNLLIDDLHQTYDKMKILNFLEGMKSLSPTARNKEIIDLGKYNNMVSATNAYITNIMSTGFDEILLLHMFEKLICFRYNTVPNILYKTNKITKTIVIFQLTEIDRIKSIVSSFHDTHIIDPNDIISLQTEYRQLCFDFGWNPKVIQNDSDLRSMDSFYKYIGYETYGSLYKCIVGSKIYKISDTRFDEKNFVNIIDEKEYLIDTYGQSKIENLSPTPIDQYFWHNNMYNGNIRLNIVPYLILSEAIRLQQFPTLDSWRSHRFIIYDLYKDSCLYKNINSKYKDKLIDVSGVSKKLSAYINIPFFTEIQSPQHYYILQKIYEFVDLN
jgi:hypothetical protein